MILGKEGVHTWATGLVLNNRAVTPHYRVDEISGLRALADLEVEADTAIGRLGEVAREIERDGKTITYDGFVIASDVVTLRTAQGELTAAFADTAVQRMDVGPHPDYVGPPLPERYFHARPLSGEPAEGQLASPKRGRSHGWEMPFQLALRLDDPRYYHADGEIEVEDAAASAVGGAGVPFTPGNRTAAPSGQGFVVETVNPGNAHTDAIVELHGPLNNPIVSSETLGLFLRFRSLVIDAGQHVTIDFRRRSVRRSSGLNVRHTLDPASTWWDRFAKCIVPGANEIRARAYSVGVGAKLVVRYVPADFA